MSLNIIGGPVAVKLDYFSVIKAPPKDILEVDIVDDTTFKINNLYKKLFQFKYRFVYDDNEKSVWSAISKIPLPAKSTDPLFNALSNVQNSIKIDLSTGDINVDKIEIAGRVNIENEWSDFFLIDTIDKKRDDVDDNVIYSYFFRNDSVYVPIDLQESNLLFDYVPDQANALELANGNTLVVGGLKDGYDRDVSLDVTITNLSNLNSPAILSTLKGTPRNESDSGPFQYINMNIGYDADSSQAKKIAGLIKFEGVPQVGDVITITISGTNHEQWFDGGGIITRYNRRRFNDSWSITVEPGWGISDIINAFLNHPNIFGNSNAWYVLAPSDLFTTGTNALPSKPFGLPDGVPFPNSLYFGAFSFPVPQSAQVDRRRWEFNSVNVSIQRSFSFGESDVFPTYKWNGLYKFGLVYYNKDGKTNGVFTNPSMTLRTGNYNTDYDWTDISAPIVIPENETAQMYIGHKPPDWADYYHVVRTKDLSSDFSLMILSCDVRRPSDGYVYLDIENIDATNAKSQETSKVIKYNAVSFVDGDRVRIMRKYNSTTKNVIWDTKDFLDLPILSVAENASRLELKLKDVDTSSNPNIITFADNDVLVLEIYRPAKVLSDEDLVYYEIGHKYNILTDVNGNRYHEGQDNVSGITIRQYLIDAPSTTTFYSTSKTIEISLPPNMAGLTQGDKISVTGTSLNNSTFTISQIINSGALFSIVVLDSVANETVTTNVLINKITNPGTSYAYINFFNDGDYYFKTRVMICDTGTTNFGPFFAADRNFSETYLSAVWSQGRPLIVDENIKEEYYPAMLRFSQSYIYGTNINNLSRFYPNNFEEADASFGDILRLKTRENFIRLFQRFKTGMIPIYRQIIIDNAQSSQVALSERLLNKPNYYAGEYGIDKYGSSLVSTDYGDYFADTINKAIVRVSLDGITNISDTNNLASWANENIREDSYGYGCFNYENRNVIILIGNREEVPLLPGVYIINNKIVAYSESDKKFESFYGFTSAERMEFVNGILFTFRQGKVYIHDSDTRNNFYGEQQSSAVHTVFNANMQLKKTYLAIEELANGLWTGALSTGPLTNQTTSLTAEDFQKVVGGITYNAMENKFNATVKRATNKPGGKFFGESMKGLYASVELNNNSSTAQRLISVSLKYIQSPLTNM